MSIETDEVALEVVECDCGFHLGIDATYLGQVGTVSIVCPACGLRIDTDDLCPGDNEMSVHEAGICPMCGQELDYGTNVPNGECLVYVCWCTVCDFVGEEVYNLVFAGHTNSTDPSGAFIE